MAKQKGIHQLKGKVGEMSYYQQKGVNGGLVRRINEGLSSRVKQDEAYANTRLNNAEFKNANAIATAAFNSVNTRKRGMMRTFAVAAMTKRALEDIKQGSGQWGVRLPNTELDVLICDMLENYAKGGKYDNQFGSFEVSEIGSDKVMNLTYTLNVEQQMSLKELGIDGIQLITSRCLAGEIIVDELPRLFAGSGITGSAPSFFDGADPVTKKESITFATPASVGMSQSGYTFAQEDGKHGFYIVVTILPMRRVGSTTHVLQEYCTYVAIPCGQPAA